MLTRCSRGASWRLHAICAKGLGEMSELIRPATLERKRGAPLPRRVVCLRALRLGDLPCAVPAFRAIRAALPNAEIVLVILPWAREFVERYAGYLDGFREFPGYPGLPEREPRIG